MKFKKSLGQNLLIDKNILKKILSLTSFKNKKIIAVSGTHGKTTEKQRNPKRNKEHMMKKQGEAWKNKGKTRKTKENMKNQENHSKIKKIRKAWKNKEKRVFLYLFVLLLLSIQNL